MTGTSASAGQTGTATPCACHMTAGGNLTQTVDAGKRRINFTYDIFNNLTSLSINGRTRLKNHYDSKGNLTGTTDALGNRTTIKNDVFGRAEKNHICRRKQH